MSCFVLRVSSVDAQPQTTPAVDSALASLVRHEDRLEVTVRLRRDRALDAVVTALEAAGFETTNATTALVTATGKRTRVALGQGHYTRTVRATIATVGAPPDERVRVTLAGVECLELNDGFTDRRPITARSRGTVGETWRHLVAAAEAIARAQ